MQKSNNYKDMNILSEYVYLCSEPWPETGLLVLPYLATPPHDR